MLVHVLSLRSVGIIIIGYTLSVCGRQYQSLFFMSVRCRPCICLYLECSWQAMYRCMCLCLECSMQALYIFTLSVHCRPCTDVYVFTLSVQCRPCMCFLPLVFAAGPGCVFTLSVSYRPCIRLYLECSMQALYESLC